MLFNKYKQTQQTCTSQRLPFDESLNPHRPKKIRMAYIEKIKQSMKINEEGMDIKQHPFIHYLFSQKFSNQNVFPIFVKRTLGCFRYFAL